MEMVWSLKEIFQYEKAAVYFAFPFWGQKAINIMDIWLIVINAC